MKKKSIKINISVFLLTAILSLSFANFSVVPFGLENNHNPFVAQIGMAAAPTKLYLPVISLNFPGTNNFAIEANINKAGGIYKMNQAQATWVRRNALLWSSIEPSPPPAALNWTAAAPLETELINAANLGMNIILIVRGTPSWAQKVPGSPCGPIASTSFSAFANFMRQAVARYSQPPYSVKYWELFNEPDVAVQTVDLPYGCWGDAADANYGGAFYGEMLKSVYPAIKQADPQAQVLIGGLLLDCDPAICATLNPPHDTKPPRFLQGILVDGAGPFFDGVSFHSYDFYNAADGMYINGNWNSAWNTTGPAFIAKANYIRGLLAAAGVNNKYLMNTEVALTNNTTNSAFEQTKSSYLTQAYVIGMATGLRANSWYAALGWFSKNTALLTPSLTPYPAYNAYKFVGNTLSNATFSQSVTTYQAQKIKVYEFLKRSNHLRIWVLWSQVSTPQTILLNSVLPDRMWTWNSVNNTYVQTPPSLSPTIGTAPVYIEWTQ